MIGQTLGHYRIESKLGEGGMGVVYRAEDTRLSRVVALKILSAERTADPQRLARFLQEARLASSLNHPNIATIHDVGEADGQHYIAMELVEGESLRARVRREPLQLPALLDLALQIADALVEAHGRGVVHRDIKAENILMTPQGRVKMLDFGLAKHLPETTDATATMVAARTETGVIMGTVSYMSPEQALGKPVDARSDLFSFGVLLYEMATGRLPFQGDTATATIDKILHQSPAPFPSELELVVLKLIEKSPEDRYQSAREVLVDVRRLKRALDTGKLESPRLRAAPPRRRRFLYAAGLFLTFAAGAMLQRYVLERPAASHSRRFTAITNFSGVEAEPAFSPDGRSVTFVSDRGGQHDIWVGLVSGGSLVRITNDPNLKAHPRWSPDGSRIVYARLNESGLWDIWSVPALGGSPRRILASAADPAWSSDGRLLAYASMTTNTIWLCEATGGNPREVTQPEQAIVHRQPALSRNGREVVFVQRTSGPYGELAVAELATGKLRRLTQDGAYAASPVWSPDGAWIYFASSLGGTVNIWKVSAAGGQAEQITAGQGDDAQLDLSTDGTRLVFSSFRSNINLAELPIDTEAGKLKWLTADAARGEFVPAYSPDGRRIAYFTNRKGVEKESIWVMDADGSNPLQLVEDERANIFPRWSRDGQSLVYVAVPSRLDPLLRWTNLEVRRAELSGAAPQKLLGRPGRDAAWGDVGPDGRLVFFAANGQLRVQDPWKDQGREVEGVKGGLLARWSPDGRRVAYIVPAHAQNDPQAGLWITDLQAPPRQVFSGWVASHAWAANDEIFVTEGKPDLKAAIWRVRLDGSSPSRIASVVLIYDYWRLPTVRFDVHPDRRRIVVEALELHDADIGMLENIQ